jgi:hypothetical protein
MRRLASSTSGSTTIPCLGLFLKYLRSQASPVCTNPWWGVILHAKAGILSLWNEWVFFNHATPPGGASTLQV